MLERSGIPYKSEKFKTAKGIEYRAVRIIPGFEDDARKLIVGKGA